MKNQIKYTEDILFNNYMVSAQGEEFVHSQIPFYFSNEDWKKIKYYAEEINKIALEVLSNINNKHNKLLEYFDDFPYKNEIFSLKTPLAPMFWTRYDTFFDKQGKMYFSEFNYDKPCGQKEIHLAEKCDFAGNINKGFIEKLIDYLIEISNEHYVKEEKVNVGFLIDPCHYEELHHSYYFRKIFENTKIKIIPVGNNNLSVIDGEVYGYSKEKIQIILRLFPTEFSHEVNNYQEILEAYEKGKVLIINDPRIVAIQAKGLFAYLWELIKSNSHKLNEHQKIIIRKCLPYTEILNEENAKKAISNKDKFVIKSSLGRYSQEVYIGRSYDEKSWEEQVQEILVSGKIHILQDLIDIREEYKYAPDYNSTNCPLTGYGNFGVYLMKNEVTGCLVRWSRDFLTDDYCTWMSPLGKKEFPLKLEKSEFENGGKRIEFYEKLQEDLSFQYDFTGAYTNINEYVSLDRMIINKKLLNELKYASTEFCKVLKKIYPTIQNNLELFGEILGIPKELYKMIEKSKVSECCALGRMDFVVDNGGQLKILEFNSETPAGLVEAIGVNQLIKDKLKLPYKDINEGFRKKIKEVLNNIIKELERSQEVKNIAVVTSWYYEDIYNTKIIAEILEECGDYKIIFGNVYDMKVKKNDIYLYNNKIDAIYRYYPLDWFYYEEEMRKLIKPLSAKEYLINPAHTLITQSKAFFAVLYGVLGMGILDNEEEEFIRKYIPYTTLEKDRVLAHDYLAKPYLSREGHGIVDNYGQLDEEEDYIFQDRVNVKPLRMDVYSTLIKKNKFQFPILGVYITGDKPSGIYTRMGEFITDASAKYISTYLK